MSPPTPRPTSLTGSCPDTDWVPHGLFCYLFQAVRTPWPLAEFQCVQKGGHLVSIVDKAENDFVQGQLKAEEITEKNAWIGMLKKGTSKMVLDLKAANKL